MPFRTNADWLIRAVAPLKLRLQKYARKWRRLQMSRPLKHMSDCSPHLQLLPTPQRGGRDILWRGKLVGRLQDVGELRNRYSGSCFVIGAGPSLADVDLRRLADWPTIGVNGTIVKFQHDGVRPSFYSITDPDFFRNRFALVRAVLASGAMCFFPYTGLSSICEQEVELLRGVSLGLSEIVNRRYFVPRLPPDDCDAQCEQDPDLVLHPTVRGQEGLVGFSRNMAKGMFCGQTVGYRGIQIAYHLGYRRVFLVGMDFGSRGSQVRFYETSAEARPSLLEQHFDGYIRPCFEIVKSLCDAGELEVYNCSPTSRLPDRLVPRISLERAVAMCRAGTPVDSDGEAWRSKAS